MKHKNNNIENNKIVPSKTGEHKMDKNQLKNSLVSLQTYSTVSVQGFQQMKKPKMGLTS
jgi:hypothetical protein